MTAAVFNVAGLAERWGCGTDAVYALIKSGQLAAFKLGNKLYRIRAVEVERYECQNIASNDTEASSPSSGSKTANDTGIRLERLIDRQASPQRARSGSGGR
jgi:excisionase family DNA binding protein